MYKFICVDFQKEFTTKEGKWFNKGKSVNFIKNKLVPFFREKNIKIHEIISDYRQPRPGDSGDGCHPGTKGYESEMPNDIKNDDIWIKCMNSPIWVRENAGKADKEPGLPYQDPGSFTQWLNVNFGTPNRNNKIILIGLTVDCCVLCTAQELCWRGYGVYILFEGTDAAGGDEDYKKRLLTESPIPNWANTIYWEELKMHLA